MRRFNFKEGAFYDFYPQVEIKFCNSLEAHLNQIISGFRSTDLSSIKEKHTLPIVIFLTDLNKNSGFFDISISRACAFSTSRSKSYLYWPCIYDNVEIGCKYILNVITNYPCFEQWSFERMEYRGPLYRLSFCISTTYSKSVTTYTCSPWTQSTVAKNSPARYCVGFIFCAETLRGSLCFFFL